MPVDNYLLPLGPISMVEPTYSIAVDAEGSVQESKGAPTNPYYAVTSGLT